MDLLLTGAGGSASANFLDALMLADPTIRVVGADCDPIFLPLSKASIKARVPEALDSTYVSAISRLIREWGAAALWAQPDQEVRVLSRHREDLPLDMFLPSQRALEISWDKNRTAQVLQAANVACPWSDSPGSREELIATVATVLTAQPKAWVRAKRGAGSRSALPVSTPDQAVAWCEWWISERGMSWQDFMVAEFLPGAEFAVQSVWQDGVCISMEARERVRYLYGFLSPSGQSSTPSVAKTTARTDVLDTAMRAVLALDPQPHGIYGVDMKEDESGEPRVTEVNAGRFFTTCNFLAHAGVNMPYMAYRASVGHRLTPLGIGTLEPDLYWVRMVDMGYQLIRASDGWTPGPLARV